MNRLPRNILAVLLPIAVAIVGSTSPALAQLDPFDPLNPTEADSVEVANPDSLEAGELLPGEIPGQIPGALGLPPATTGFHPRYQTSYKVFKTKKTWDQTFSLNQKLDAVTFNGSLSSNINKDEAQNNLESYLSRSNNQLDYAIGGGFSVGVLASFDRSNRISATQTIKDKNDQFRLTTRGDRVILGGMFKTTANGQAGIRDSENSGDRRVGATSRRDRTTQTGPSFSAGWSISNDVDPAKRPPVIIDVDFTSDWFRQETREQRTELASDLETVTSESDTTLKATNSSRRLTGGLKWTPGTWLDFDVDLSRTYSRQLRPAPSRGELEENERDETKGSITARASPAGDLTLTLDLDAGDNKLGSNLNTSSNRDVTSSGFSLRAEYLWLGFQMMSEFEQSNEKQDYRPVPGSAPQSDLTTDFVRLRGQLARGLSRTVKATLTGDISLDQKFYEDGVLDTDRQDRTTDLTVSYAPSGALRSRVSLTSNRKRNVNTDPGRATNTNTEERVSVGAGYTYTTRWKVTIDQNLTITAQSRVFDFNDADQSDLSRTNRLTTRVQSTLLPEVAIRLEHNYNFRNTGQYNRDPDGVRRFRLSREYIEQELKVGTAYNPVTWFDLNAEQSLRVVTNRSPGSEGITTSQYELKVEGNLNRRLLESIDARLNVMRVLSTREEHHWRVNMSANRTF